MPPKVDVAAVGTVPNPITNMCKTRYHRAISQLNGRAASLRTAQASDERFGVALGALDHVVGEHCVVIAIGCPATSQRLKILRQSRQIRRLQKHARCLTIGALWEVAERGASALRKI